MEEEDEDVFLEEILLCDEEMNVFWVVVVVLFIKWRCFVIFSFDIEMSSLGVIFFCFVG